LLLLQISENLKDCEARQLAAKDTVEKAEEKLLPVQVGLITDLYFSISSRKFKLSLNL